MRPPDEEPCRDPQADPLAVPLGGRELLLGTGRLRLLKVPCRLCQSPGGWVGNAGWVGWDGCGGANGDQSGAAAIAVGDGLESLLAFQNAVVDGDQTEACLVEVASRVVAWCVAGHRVGEHEAAMNILSVV